MLSPVPHPLLPDWPVFVFHEPTATVKRASELSGLSVRKLQELMGKNLIAFERIGKANLIVMSTLSEFLKREYHANPNPRDVRLTQLRGIGTR